MKKLEDYNSTKHKVHYLWEAIKELVGLELELLQRIKELKKEVLNIESQIYNVQ